MIFGVIPHTKNKLMRKAMIAYFSTPIISLPFLNHFHYFFQVNAMGAFNEDDVPGVSHFL